jgi:ABC-type uncharacterized transport system involved in gliding motility auxiliary subunit
MAQKRSYIHRLNLLSLLRLGNYKKNMIYAVAFILLVGINVLLSPFMFRMDLSKGKAYTLSSSTKNVMKSIQKPVSINFFVSSELPTRLLPLRREVTDLLNEYKRLGAGKLQVTILDPKKDPKALEKAKSIGMPELQFSQVDQDKYAVTTSYFGISLEQGDKHELLPQVTEIGSLEYNLTAALYKLTRKEAPKVGMVGEGVEGAIATTQNVLSQQFTMEPVVATDSGSIDPAYRTLFIFTPTDKKYSNEEVTALERYLEQGGKGIFFVDGVSISDSLSVLPADHNLNTLLKKWGITVNSNLILSNSAELVNFGNELVSYLVPYPFWIKTDQVDSKSSYFSNVNQLTFPWTSSLTLQNANGIETHSLVSSTKRSWEQTSNFSLSPQTISPPKENELRQFTLIAESKRKNGGAILVIPSSRFISDKYLSRTSDNTAFILNVVNDFASGGALSGIRQRAVSFYPLPDIGNNVKDIFKYANILLLPGLFVLYGVIRLMRRR